MVEQLTSERKNPQREASIEFGPFKSAEVLKRFFLYVTDFTNVDVLSNPFFDIYPPIKRNNIPVLDSGSLRQAGSSFTCNGVFKRFIPIEGSVDFLVTEYDFLKRVSIQSTKIRAGIFSSSESRIQANWTFKEDTPEPNAIFSLEIYGFSGLLPSQNDVQRGIQNVGIKIAQGFKEQEKVLKGS